MMIERQSSFMNSNTLEKCRQSLGLACGSAVPKLLPFGESVKSQRLGKVTRSIYDVSAV